MNSGRPCIFGEVLFDHFPDGSRVLGGAPFNVAWHLQAFGQAPRFISRVGRDAEGDHIRDAMGNWGMDTATLQTDDKLPTGRVSVSIADGEPSYDIVRPVAYDAIDPCTGCDDCDLLYHGSLALRDTTSQQALNALLASRPGRVFVDVNLRPPWWRREVLTGLLHGADWVKINADELAELQPQAGPDAAAAMLADYGLQGLILTRGARGAELLTAAGERHAVTPSDDVAVVDTVGAGDAFAAVTILGLLRDWPLDVTLQRAQQFASRLVGNRGATVADMAFYKPFIDAWKLAN